MAFKTVIKNVELSTSYIKYDSGYTTALFTITSTVEYNANLLDQSGYLLFSKSGSN